MDFEKKVIEYRRIFHRFPEPGWLTYFAGIFLADRLESCGFEVHVGTEIYGDEPLMDAPDMSQIAHYEKMALINAASLSVADPQRWLDRMNHGTGVVAILDTGRSGKVKAFRFDMDALTVQESCLSDHLPMQNGFQSEYEGNFHACGHDGHMAMGLALAEFAASQRDSLNGKIMFIFQPAEEGVRGAMAFCNRWRYGKIDELYCCHIGFAPEDTFVAGAKGFLATTKMDMTIHGKSAHAGLAPERGRNALLAAAEAMMRMEQIQKPREGIARLNVGQLFGGENRNTIPAEAFMKMETRGSDSAINTYMEEEARRCIREACEKYETTFEIAYQGASTSASSDERLAEQVLELAKNRGEFLCYERSKEFGASDDGAVFMNMVQKMGGQATYMLLGCRINGLHHESNFDFEETVLVRGLHIMEAALK